MILVFDLDDTLYPEISYVHSGFWAVANAMYDLHGWDQRESFDIMVDTLRASGRGKVFDSLLSAHNLLSRRLVLNCLSVYRKHSPAIFLPKESQEFLRSWPAKPYLVTDGNKLVQANKVTALDLWGRFSRVFVTHRYGLHHAKPSTYCFQLIKNIEGCDWSDMVYVGDNPAKDFVGLNALGAKTVRVLTGEHAITKAKSGYDAQVSIEGIHQLLNVVSSFG